MTAFRTMTTRMATASMFSPIAKATAAAASSRSTMRLWNWSTKIAKGDGAASRPGRWARTARAAGRPRRRSSRARGRCGCAGSPRQRAARATLRRSRELAPSPARSLYEEHPDRGVIENPSATLPSRSRRDRPCPGRRRPADPPGRRPLLGAARPAARLPARSRERATRPASTVPRPARPPARLPGTLCIEVAADASHRSANRSRQQRPRAREHRLQDPDHLDARAGRWLEPGEQEPERAACIAGAVRRKDHAAGLDGVGP